MSAESIVRKPPTPSEEFSRPDLDAWAAAAERSLAGGSLAELTTPVAEGVAARPLYTAADAPEPPAYPGLAPFVRGTRPIAAAGDSWHGCVRCDHPEPTVAAEWISEAAARGLSSAWLVFDRGARRALDAGDPHLGSLADGVVVSTASDVARLTAAADAAAAAILVDGGGNGVALAAAVLASRRDGAADLTVPASLGWDPLGSLAADGDLPYGLERSLELLADVAAWAERSGSGGSAVTVSTLPYVDAGAGPVLELACAAATGVEYLRSMTAAGLGLEPASRRLDLRVGVGLDLFVEVAKLRALRRIWSRIVEACGGTEEARCARIHAVTPRRWLTRRDPWVNMLRGTTAAFAAVAGGAEHVTVPPFDAVLGLPGDLGRRIAANLHVILREESHLGRVADPAGGSYLVERLTGDLADAAWARFQQIERAGGMTSVLLDGSLRADLAAAAGRQAEEVATRRHPITGVSSFPNLTEIPPETAPRARPAAARRPGVASSNLQGLLADVARAAAAGRGDGSVLEAAVAALAAGADVNAVAVAIRGDASRRTIEPLEARRTAEAFERLRDASDRRLARHGARPRAVLAQAGAGAGSRAAAELAAGVLATGGIEVAGDGRPHGLGEAAAVLAGSGAVAACVCLDGDGDPDEARQAVEALRAAGAEVVVGVTTAAADTDRWRPAGFHHLISEGTDVLPALRSILAARGGLDG